jgi:hypothetical protein
MQVVDVGQASRMMVSWLYCHTRGVRLAYVQKARYSSR